MSKVELDREPWIDEIEASLREAEAPVPLAGWERLERALTTPAVPLYRRWWPRAAAAAVLLAAVTWSVRIYLPNPEPAGRLAERSAAAEEEDRLLPAAEISAAEVAAAAARRPNRQAVDGSGADSPAGLLATHSADCCAGVPAEAAIAENGPEHVAAGPEREAAKRRSDAVSGSVTSSGDAAVSDEEAAAGGRTLMRPFRPAVRRHRPVSIGISMSGGITLSGGAGRSGAMLLPATLFMQNSAPEMADAVASNTVYEDGKLWVNSPMEEWSYDHRVPLSFGFTVGRELAAGVTLASGVHYTLLRSEATVSQQSARLRQRLHFIGIPVRVEVRFLRRSDFSLYAGAGVMAEKCVGGRLGDRPVRIPSVQWSVGGSVGAQYALGGHAALYFEPDLSYYLTRSELRTVRTDSPLTLSLRLGVKLTY